MLPIVGKWAIGGGMSVKWGENNCLGGEMYLYTVQMTHPLAYLCTTLHIYALFTLNCCINLQSCCILLHTRQLLLLPSNPEPVIETISRESPATTSITMQLTRHMHAPCPPCCGVVAGCCGLVAEGWWDCWGCYPTHRVRSVLLCHSLTGGVPRVGVAHYFYIPSL